MALSPCICAVVRLAKYPLVLGYKNSVTRNVTKSALRFLKAAVVAAAKSFTLPLHHAGIHRMCPCSAMAHEHLLQLAVSQDAGFDHRTKGHAAARKVKLSAQARLLPDRFPAAIERVF